MAVYWGKTDAYRVAEIESGEREEEDQVGTTNKGIFTGRPRRSERKIKKLKVVAEVTNEKLESADMDTIKELVKIELCNRVAKELLNHIPYFNVELLDNGSGARFIIEINILMPPEGEIV